MLLQAWNADFRKPHSAFESRREQSDIVSDSLYTTVHSASVIHGRDSHGHFPLQLDLLITSALCVPLMNTQGTKPFAMIVVANKSSMEHFSEIDANKIVGFATYAEIAFGNIQRLGLAS